MISHLFITFYTTIVSDLERTSNFACTFFKEPIFSYSISWGSSCIGEGSRFRSACISSPFHLSNRQKCLIFSFFSVKAYICKLFTFILCFWWRGDKASHCSVCPTKEKPHQMDRPSHNSKLGSIMAFRLMLFIAWVHSMIVTGFPEIPSYDLVPTKPIRT
jgi:hypothetical protein